MDAIQRGRKEWQDNGCADIVLSMYKLARGYTFQEKKVVQKKKLVKTGYDKKSGKYTYEMRVVEEDTTGKLVTVQPNHAAQQTILFNRDGKRWKSQKEFIDRPNGGEGTPEEFARDLFEIQEAMNGTIGGVEE